MTKREIIRMMIEVNRWKIDYYGRNPRLITITSDGTREYCETIQRVLKGSVKWQDKDRYGWPSTASDYCWMPYDDDREEIAGLMSEIIEDFDPFGNKRFVRQLWHGIQEEKIWSKS